MKQLSIWCIGVFVLFGTNACGSRSTPEPSRDELEKMTAVQRGAIFIKTRGCMDCHPMTEALRATTQEASPLTGMYSSTVIHTDGSTATVDEAYLRDSIINPRARVIRGQPATMPALQFKATEIDDLVQFIKSLEKISRSEK